MAPFHLSRCRQLVIAAIVALFLGAGVSAFSVTPAGRPSTALDMFGGLQKAFANEDMGPRKNAGLSNGPNFNEQVTVNGKPVQGAVVGQKLTVVASKVRVKIPVNCQKGDCGTCTVNLNGRKVKACQTPLPAGKATIRT